MNTVIITLTILIILFILVQYILPKSITELFTSDEAIKNVASLYNTDKLTVNKLQLGGKWVLSGVGDKHGNDDWLRLLGVDETDYSGGIAARKLWVDGVGEVTPAITDIQNKINNLTNRINDVQNSATNAQNTANSMRIGCNWGGEKAVYGDRGCEDDVAINCDNGKVVGIRHMC